jgi:RecA/RadA recombinase
MAEKFDVVDIVMEVGKELSMSPVHLARGSFVENSISSGSLTYDLVTGGGFSPGRVTMLKGFEGAGKTVFCYTSIKDAIKKGIPAIFIDAEGSADTLFMKRIGIDIDKDCGIQGAKGEWIEKPKLLFEQPDTGEQVFRFIKRILEKMPDKTKDPRSNDNEWIYTHADGKTSKAKPGIEVLFFVDSFAALVPEASQEDDESSPTAMQARMFSDNLRLIKSLISQKQAVLVATNQMRINPRKMFGSPNYMPGGEAVKHYNDVRVELTRCAVPKGKAIEEEPCWDDNGVDRYVYTKFYLDKNKCFSPFRGSILRIWFEEKGMPGRGIDPVWDTWQYLVETGQGKDAGRNKFIIKTPFMDDTMKWLDFKKFILDPASSFDFRAECRKQIEDGTAFQLYFDTIGKVGNNKIETKVMVCQNCISYAECKKKKFVKAAQPACEKYEEARSEESYESSSELKEEGSLNLDTES